MQVGVAVILADLVNDGGVVTGMSLQEGLFYHEGFKLVLGLVKFAVLGVHDEQELLGQSRRLR